MSLAIRLFKPNDVWFCWYSGKNGPNASWWIYFSSLFSFMIFYFNISFKSKLISSR